MTQGLGCRVKDRLYPVGGTKSRTRHGPSTNSSTVGGRTREEVLLGESPRGLLHQDRTARARSRERALGRLWKAMP